MNKNTIPAVDKAIRIMDILTQGNESLTQSELVRRTGISSSTGYRILQTLLEHGWIGQDGTRYRASSRFRRDGDPLSRILSVAQRELDTLSRMTHLFSKLSIRRDGKQHSILGSESPDPFSVSGKIGSSFPLVEGSVGASLLMKEPEDAIRKLVRETPEKIPETENPGLILERIALLKRNGYVINQTQNRWMVHAMSVPVTVGGRVLAALTILGTKEDFPEQAIGSYAEALFHVRNQIQIYAGAKHEN